MISREHSSPCEVISKYFKQSKCVMDISSSDFQDKKCNIKGPKTTQKPVTKVKKTSKRLKGQKDIRIALKSKKNELLTYTKEFDKVCKQSGVDVDSEQLQLAVALSKSLHNTEHLENCNVPNSSSLNSQDRTGNIRTTLQEYGFTIPEIKITKNKRFKKHKRDYKLLLLSEQEKQQSISDKYAQVLFQNVVNFKVTNSQLDYSNKELYYKATSISYREIKTNDLLYVNNLIGKSTSTGSLLRNWEDIPGRPKSPSNCEPFNMNFSEIDCSQDELDIVLSGSLKSAKDVVKNKVKVMSVSAPIIIADDIDIEKHAKIRGLSDQNMYKKCDNAFINISNDQNVALDNKTNKNMSSDSSILDKQSITVKKITRSCSPDIFDDEVSTILDTSEEHKNVVYSELIDSIIEDNNKSNCRQASQRNVTNRKSNDMMEITDCVVFSGVPENGDMHRKPNLSHSNLTNTKSTKYNNVIEITDCVPIEHRNKSLSQMNSSKCSNVCSQPTYSSNVTKRISNDFMEITDCVAHTTKRKYAPVSTDTNIDLTHDSNEEDELTVVDGNLSTKEAPNTSQTSSGDELPIIVMDGSSNKSLDNTVILNDDEINTVVHHTPMHRLKMHQNITTNEESSKSYSLNKTSVEDKESCAANVNQSFFDEFVHNHSDDTIESNTALMKATNNDKEIDLTQSSDEAIEIDPPVEVDKSILGYHEDVSIDYDDLYDEALQISKDTHSNINNLSQQSNVNNIKENNLALSKASSDTSNQNSGVHDFSDQELNYSINKSRHEIPWENFGGISVLDDISKVEFSRISEGAIQNKCSEPLSAVRSSMSDSFLPVVDIKGKAKVNETSKEIVATPKKDLAKATALAIGTPANSDYIIKTDQVTPMVDYEKMSSPERNRELDRYGLKPFKRKRAVQLLTHLYNQTHPVVQLPQEIPSPSKKRKHSQPSPIKSLESGKQNANNVLECDKENNLYELTNELPYITAIDCLEEDWVFQKREKAKIPSCRVPLHIAFHNYVSCRRWLREAILRYEPVNIDDIHKGLVATGCRYDAKELLKFMDKKCITVKTADNNARNKR